MGFFDIADPVYLVFHDERYIGKEWLYHAFFLVNKGCLENDLAKVETEKTRIGYTGKVRFKDITSTSSGSFNVAKSWIRLFYSELYRTCRYSILGVNLNNIDYDFFGQRGERGRHSRIFQRFFEIGLYGALRHFFPSHSVTVSKIFTDPKNFGVGHPFYRRPVYKILEKEAFRTNKIRMQCVGITILKRHSFLEFIDVLLGANSEVLDYSSKTEGHVKLAAEIFEYTEQMIIKPYNINSKYYKRHTLSFFPAKRISPSDCESTPLMRFGKDYFYKTRDLKLGTRDQEKLFEENV